MTMCLYSESHKAIYKELLQMIALIPKRAPAKDPTPKIVLKLWQPCEARQHNPRAFHA